MSEQPIVVQVEFDRIAKFIEEKLEALKRELAPKPERGGKGETIAPCEDYRRRIVESLKCGRSIREQWETPLIQPTAPTASLINHVYVSRELEARRVPVGSVVHIPVVKDVEAEVLSAPGGALTTRMGLYEVISASVEEVGVTTEIGYHVIEQLSEDLLAAIESVFQRAILRAMDKSILDKIAARNDVPVLDRSSGQSCFEATYIAEAMEVISSHGKDARPQDFILVINPTQHAALCKDIVKSQALVFARPDIIRDGIITEFMGVRILVSGYLPQVEGGKKCAILMHRNAVVVAPQRNILIETERDAQKRLIKLTGTATFAAAIVDPKAICKIMTPA